MPKVIFVNGPRGSGKDTTTELLIKLYDQAKVYKMTTPMDLAMPRLLGLTDAEWGRLRHDTKLKIQPSPKLFGCTPVECLIKLSEIYMKETFGEDVFGRVAVRYLKKAEDSTLFVISDSRFAAEIQPMRRHFGVDNTLILRLHRDGCSWERDRRDFGDSPDAGYLQGPSLCEDIDNNGSKDDLARMILRAVDPWLGG